MVGGYITLSNSTTDAWVQKYSSTGTALGAPAWPRTYNGAADQDDVVNAVVIDSTDFIYGVGTETVASANLNAWMRKFAP